MFVIAYKNQSKWWAEWVTHHQTKNLKENDCTQYEESGIQGELNSFQDHIYVELVIVTRRIGASFRLKLFTFVFRDGDDSGMVFLCIAFENESEPCQEDEFLDFGIKALNIPNHFPNEKVMLSG